MHGVVHDHVGICRLLGSAGGQLDVCPQLHSPFVVLFQQCLQGKGTFSILILFDLQHNPSLQKGASLFLWLAAEFAAVFLRSIQSLRLLLFIPGGFC